MHWERTNKLIQIINSNLNLEINTFDNNLFYSDVSTTVSSQDNIVTMKSVLTVRREISVDINESNRNELYQCKTYFKMNQNPAFNRSDEQQFSELNMFNNTSDFTHECSFYVSWPVVVNSNPEGSII